MKLKRSPIAHILHPDAGLHPEDVYREIEGWMEERMSDMQGEFQGGAIGVINADEVAA